MAPFATSCSRRHLGRIGSAWRAAARITLGLTLGILVGVVAPGALAAYANPSHGAAAAPAGKHTADAMTVSVSVAAETSLGSGSVSASASSGSSQHPSKGKAAVHVNSAEEIAECKAGLPPDGDPQPCNRSSKKAHAAAVQSPAPVTVPTTTSATTQSPPTTAAPHPALLVKASLRPSTPAPAKPGPTFLQEPIQLATGGWSGVSLRTATDLRVPALFSVAVLLFVLLQALVDRRDPKMSRAPERGEDDTVGFS